MLLDISSLNHFAGTSVQIPISVIAMVYVACTTAISKLYVVQAYRFLRGEKGAGDFCFMSKIGQALLRIAGLVYSVYINDGTVFLVIALDFVGRWIEIVAAFIAYRRFANRGLDPALALPQA